MQSQTIYRTGLLLIVFCGLFAAVNPALAQTWTLIATPGVFSIASSADGKI
jgi:hypothetical protein